MLFSAISAVGRYSLSSTQANRPVMNRVVAQAAVNAASTDASDGKNSGLLVKQATYFGLWYAANIIFNILNKSTLNAYPVPWLLSTIQLGCGVLFMCVLWLTKVVQYKPVSKDFLVAMAPVALFHLIGHVTSCISFSQMAVSFAHIVKVGDWSRGGSRSDGPAAA